MFTKQLSRYFCVIGGIMMTWGSLSSGAIAPRTQTTKVNDALLMEYDLSQNKQSFTGRILIEPGLSTWTTVADSKDVMLQARVRYLEPDVVEVETRLDRNQSMSFTVRLGEKAEMAVRQPNTLGKVADEAATTNLSLKVLKVRYSLN